MKTSIYRIAAALIVILSLPLICLAANDTVTLAQYEQVLGDVQAKLDASASAVKTGGSIADEMPGALAKRELGPIRFVRLIDGSLMHVDTAGMTASIVKADNANSGDDQESGYEAVSRRIAALRDEVAAEGGLPRVDPSAPSGKPLPADHSRDLARQILSGPGFASDPTPPPSWLDREMLRFEKWMDDELNKLRFRGNNNVNMPNISAKLLWTFAWIFVAALFALLVWIIVQVIGRRQAKAKPLKLTDSEQALVEARDKDTLVTLAEKHARSGDYRAAFRLIYLATLIALDTEGILRFDRSKTNWEYVRQLRSSGRPDVYEILLPMTREFDRVWYGLSPTGPEVYRRAVVEYEKLTAPPEKSAIATA